MLSAVNSFMREAPIMQKPVHLFALQILYDRELRREIVHCCRKKLHHRVVRLNSESESVLLIGKYLLKTNNKGAITSSLFLTFDICPQDKLQPNLGYLQRFLTEWGELRSNGKTFIQKTDQIELIQFFDLSSKFSQKFSSV